MKIFVVNYGGDNFTPFARLNTKCAYKYGRVDHVYTYTPDDIDVDFRKKHAKILSSSLGGGYWLWKPYIIKKTLSQIQDGDYLVYLDSGSSYVCGPVKPLIDEIEKKGMWLYAMQMDFVERQYTKRDAFVLMDSDRCEYTDTGQYWAGIQIYKKCSSSIAFVDDWLSYASDRRIITNDDNTCGKENYPDFIAHRHDQSIFSLLCKKGGITPSDSIVCNMNKKVKHNVIFYLRHRRKLGVSMVIITKILLLLLVCQLNIQIIINKKG